MYNIVTTTKLFVIITVSIITLTAFAPTYQIGLLKYNGGGDWYANKETSLANLIAFCNQELHTNFMPEQGIVDVGSPDLYSYPLVHMTGHGNVLFNTQEAQNLRNYLIGGGFLHISDNYGMDKFIRPQLKKVFPELELVELPYSHPIYHQHYDFANGLPKVHEHDSKPAKGWGLIYNGQLVCFYDQECDLGDGWENYEIHKDSEATHKKALQMGANIVQYAMMRK